MSRRVKLTLFPVGVFVLLFMYWLLTSHPSNTIEHVDLREPSNSPDRELVEFEPPQNHVQPNNADQSNVLVLPTEIPTPVAGHKKPGTVIAVVRSGQGFPLSGVVVCLEQPRSTSRELLKSVTDGYGEARFVNLSPETEYVVRADSDSTDGMIGTVVCIEPGEKELKEEFDNSVAKSVEVTEGKQTTVELVLGRGSWVKGRFVTDDGSTASKVQYFLYPLEGKLSHENTCYLGTRTDEEGRFTYHCFESGKYWLKGQVDIDGWKYWTEGLRIDVYAGQQIDIGNVTLRKLRRLRCLVYYQGLPIKNFDCKVMVYERQNGVTDYDTFLRYSGQTDQNGFYSVSPMYLTNQIDLQSQYEVQLSTGPLTGNDRWIWTEDVTGSMLSDQILRVDLPSLPPGYVQ